MQSLKQIVELNHQKICSGTQTMPKSLPQKPTSSNSNDTKSESKRIDVLFSKFAAFYGHIWRSQFKDEGFLGFSKKEWADALSGFNDDVLTKAILNCRDFYELPPTLPQLIGCCRQINRQSTFYVKQSGYVPASQEVVEFNVKKCKEMLGKQ